MLIESSLDVQLNLKSSNTFGSFTMANLLVFKSLRNSSGRPRKQIFKEMLLFYRVIACYVYSLESPD